MRSPGVWKPLTASYHSSSIAAQSAAIADYQAKIAFLQLNLAVRVAIEDDDDELQDDTKSSSPDTPNVEKAVQSPSDSVAVSAALQTAQEELATAMSARAALEVRLAELETELTAAMQAGEVSSAFVSNLEQQLDAARFDVAARDERLRKTDDLASSLGAELAGANERIIALEGEVREAKLVVANLQTQAADAADKQARLLDEQASADALTKRVQEVRCS